MTPARPLFSFVPLLFASLAACASSSTATSSLPARPSSQTAGLSTGGQSIRVTSNATANVTTLPYPIESIWSLMPLVYDSLNVPIGKVEPGVHTIGNDGFKIRQRLGKTSLSRYIDCGQAQIGPNADSYDVVLTVVTQLTPNNDKTTTVATSVLASAKPVTYNQGYSQCSTKGGLEAKVLSVLRTALAR